MHGNPDGDGDVGELISLARSGCDVSLGTLLQMYRSYLRLVASVQLDRQLQEKFSPSDIVQATFLQAHRGFVNFAGKTEGELIAWLRRILISQLIMEIRRYSTEARDVKLERQMRLQIDQSSVLLANMIPFNGDTPSQNEMRRERAVLLANAMAQLPDHYRQVIVLRHLKAYSFSEVADEMEQSVDSVKAIWRRAIARLRGLIGDGPF